MLQLLIQDDLSSAIVVLELWKQYEEADEADVKKIAKIHQLSVKVSHAIDRLILSD